MGFQRQTYHLALTYVDMALTRTKQEVKDIQLLGITAMYIAMKTEEVELKPCKAFESYTERACKEAQIAQKEKEMIYSFQWHTNPDTMCFWLDAHMSAWDAFIVKSRHFELVKRFKFEDNPHNEFYKPVLNYLTHNFQCFS